MQEKYCGGLKKVSTHINQLGFQPLSISDHRFVNFSLGAYMGIQASHGFWPQEEHNMHINVLELQAMLMGLNNLCVAL